MHIPVCQKNGAFHTGIQKNRAIHILFVEKRGPIIYLAALKRGGGGGAIRHAHPYCAIYRELPPRGRIQDYLIGSSRDIDLTFTTLLANSAEDKLVVFFLTFPRKQNKKNISKCRLLKILPRVLSANQSTVLTYSMYTTRQALANI